ncbi:MAG TPA: hypothetical protein DEP84_29575 [Chloroflexi bacterium]|nr:hypothetical protein [Chloroflexota bacterium]
MPLFGPKYDDEQLCMRAEHALAEDPVVPAVRVGVSCENGVVVLSGTVNSEREETHAVEVVRHALDAAQLQYDRVVDELVVGASLNEPEAQGEGWPQSERLENFDEHNWNPEMPTRMPPHQ